ncbi:MAG: hypothetical protein AAFW82_02395 [Pseudomonadota bacterium]
MSYRSLESEKIVKTLGHLVIRITERFPEAGLAKVCEELEQVARDTRRRTERISKPNKLMRLSVATVIIGGVLAIAYVGSIIDYNKDQENLFGILQGIEALINIIVVMGAAVFFLMTVEARWKRQIAIGYLHELRMIVHVIDMHQLTKDPSSPLRRAGNTPSSPLRTMSMFELVRYLDYCSEMYSLAAKVAMLYAQSSSDNQVISTVTEIEQITSNLSSKVWQKITIIQGLGESVAIHDAGDMPAMP